MPLAFRYAARSDVGMVRSNNEDSGYAGPHLLAMADGMGGHAGGEIASSTVIGALVDLDIQAFGAGELSVALLERIHDANSELGARAEAEPQLAGMGTTLIALLRARDKIVLAHIGDSRAFLAREGQVVQVTKDHSFVQALVDEGRITAEEANTHPQRSLVTRVLTGHEDDEPDLVLRQARIGDRYLICSDGLSDYVARDTVDEVLLETADPGEAADRLVALALRAGAPDNVTVVIGDVVDLSSGQLPDTAPQIVGAAASRRIGTRPMPLTPAAKAAELSRTATGGAKDEDVVLAEEGPPTRRARAARWIAGLAATALVLTGIWFAGNGWLRSQWFLQDDRGTVSLYQGVRPDLGPLTTHWFVEDTGISVDNLPTAVRDNLETTNLSSRAEADARIAFLALQARACSWAKANSQECSTVPDTWTTPTPRLATSTNGTGSAAATVTKTVTATPASTP